MPIPEQPRRILLLARDMLGDLVNTTGALPAIQKRFPQSHLVLEGGPAAAELFPDIEVWVRKRGGLQEKLRRIAAFRAGKFDLALSLDDGHEFARLAKRAKIPIVGCHRGRADLYELAVERPEGSHDMFGVLDSLLRALGADPYPGPVLPVAPEHEAKAVLLAPARAVGLFVGASDPAKAWPIERWIELAGQIQEPAVLLAGPKEGELLAEIALATGLPALPNTLDVLTLAAVIRRLKALVSADTGPAHIAGAVGTPVVVLYGPTDPARFHPWGAQWRAVRAMDTCEHYGSGCAFAENKVCPQTCMRANEPAAVLAALADLVR